MEPFGGESFRRFRFAVGRPWGAAGGGPPGLSLPARLALAAAAIVLTLVAALLIVPALVVGVVVYVAASGVASLRRRLSGRRRPGGALDGRRNVRVIARDGPA